MLINYVDSLKVWGLRPHTPPLTTSGDLRRLNVLSVVASKLDLHIPLPELATLHPPQMKSTGRQGLTGLLQSTHAASSLKRHGSIGSAQHRQAVEHRPVHAAIQLEADDIFIR